MKAVILLEAWELVLQKRPIFVPNRWLRLVGSRSCGTL